MPKLQFGLGLNFNANTGKFIKSIEGASNSLNKLKRKTDDVDKVNKGFFERISESKPFRKFGSFVSAVGNQTDKLTGSLSSSLMGYVKINREVSEATANFGLIGKEANTLKKALIGLNLGYAINIDSVAQLVSGLKQSGIDITNNTDKIKKYAKYMEGLQVTPDVITSFFAYGKSLNYTEKQIEVMLDRVVMLGKETGDVSGVVSKYPDVLRGVIDSTQAFEQSFKKLGISQTEYAERMIMSGTAVGKALGIGFEDGVKVVSELTTSLFDAQKGLAQFRAGVEGAAITDELVELGIITGDVGEAFREMQKDPTLFIRSMSDMVVKLRKLGKTESLKILQTRIEDTFGADFTRLIFNNADKFVMSIDTMNESVKKSEGMAQKVTQATLGTAGRTIEALQAQLDYQIGQLKARALPLIIKALKSFNKFVSRITKFLDDIGKKHPALGNLLDRVIAFTEIGASGFFAMTPVIFPVLMGLQSISLVAGELASGFKFLFGLIGKGLGLFSGLGKTLSSIVPFSKGLLGALGKIFFWVGLIIASIKPMIKLFENLGKIWGDKTKSAGDKVIEIFKSVIKTIWDIFNNFFFGIPQKIAEMLGLVKPDRAISGKDTKKRVKGRDVVDTKTMSILGGVSFANMIDDVINKLVRVVGKLLNKVKVLFMNLLNQASLWLLQNVDKISGWLSQMADKILPFVMSLLNFAIDFISKINWDVVLNAWSVWFFSVIKIGWNILSNMIVSWLPYLGVKLLKLAVKLVMSIFTGIIKFWVKNIVSRIITFIWSFIKTIAKNLVGFITGKITFSEMFGDFLKSYDEVSKVIGKEADKFSEATDLVWDTSAFEKFMDKTAEYWIKKDEAVIDNTNALIENTKQLQQKDKPKIAKGRAMTKSAISIGAGVTNVKTEKSVSGIASNVSGGGLRLKVKVGI